MQLIQSGPRNAKVVVVGESPGRNEMASGKPFVGASGDLFNRAIDVANKSLGRRVLIRDEMFITNLAHEQPPGDKFEYFISPAIKPQLMMGILQLKKDLEEIRPNLVIALGQYPLRFLTGKQGIGNWRGSILPCTLVPSLKVVATFHPASIFRTYENNGVFQADIRRCAAQAEFPDLRLPRRTFYIDPPSGQQLDDLVRELASAEWLATDVECFQRPDGSWELGCVGFSDRPDRALTITRRHPDFRRIVGWLCSCSAGKIFQNGQFDIPVLADNGFPLIKAHAWDTMYAHHAILPECAGAEDEVKMLKGQKGNAAKSALGKGLAYQTSVYTDEPRYKDDGKVWKQIK